MGILDSNIQKCIPFIKGDTLSTGNFVSSITKVVENPKQMPWLCVKVELNPYNDGEKWDCECAVESTMYKNTYILSNFNEIGYSIKENGLYYIPTFGANVTLWFKNGDSSTTKSGTIVYNHVASVPVTADKRVQLLSKASVTVSSANSYAVASNIDIRPFKFFFIVAAAYNNGSLVSRDFNIRITKRFKLDGESSTIPVKTETIERVSALTSGVTEWQQVTSEAIDSDIYLESPNAGDVFKVNVYGVR